MTVGERIRKTRQSKGMTQKQLGEKARIAEPTIRRYELGRLNPKIGTLQKIADALEVHVFDLTGISEPLSKYVYDLTDITSATGEPLSDSEKQKFVSLLTSKERWSDIYDMLSDDDKDAFWEMVDETGRRRPHTVVDEGLKAPDGYNKLTAANRKIVDHLIVELAKSQSSE